ncbi:MAG: ribbon-helix-helix domain-containing protein [archaeon YNP-WB-040]|jgi:Arc/MetJ-type ribon-helix-helix transcriptional regulator|nr:ribbon-helix-helix domain-containing protein [Candidatus Culexarchaeum yellowstonense]
MKVLSIRLPEEYVKAMDEIIRMGIYPSRSEFVRAAIREHLKREIDSSSNIRRIVREI